MSFYNNSINDFVVGSEEGELYIGDRHGSKNEVAKNILGFFVENDTQI